MNLFFKLFKGELERMVSYRILPVAVGTSLIWVGIFALLSSEESRRFASLLLYMDSGLMSLLLAGAFHHLERTDGTIKTMLVLPVATWTILTAKAMAAAALGLLSALVVSLSLLFLHGIRMDYLLLALFTFVTAVTHAGIGLVLALRSRDFSATLGWVMLLMLLSLLPVILHLTGAIPESFSWALLVSPSGAATAALDFATGNTSDRMRALLGVAWMTLVALVLYRFPVLRLFRRHACVE